MISVVSERDVYRTSDLALAAVLALAYPLEALDRHPRETQFVFRRDDYLDELVTHYWCGALRVEPQAYCHHVQLLQAQEHAITSLV